MKTKVYNSELITEKFTLKSYLHRGFTSIKTFFSSVFKAGTYFNRKKKEVTYKDRMK
jgi:hypothetical protein